MLARRLEAGDYIVTSILIEVTDYKVWALAGTLTLPIRFVEPTSGRWRRRCTDGFRLGPLIVVIFGWSFRNVEIWEEHKT